MIVFGFFHVVSNLGTLDFQQVSNNEGHWVCLCVNSHLANSS